MAIFLASIAIFVVATRVDSTNGDACKFAADEALDTEVIDASLEALDGVLEGDAERTMLAFSAADVMWYESLREAVR